MWVNNRIYTYIVEFNVLFFHERKPYTYFKYKETNVPYIQQKKKKK